MSGKKTDLTIKDKPVKPEESAKRSAKTKAKTAEKPAEKSTGAVKSAKPAAEKKAPSAKTSAKDGAKKTSAAAKSGTKKSADEKPAAERSAKTGAKKAPAKTAEAKSEKKPAVKKSVEDTAEKKPAKPRKKAETRQEEPKTGEPSSKTPQVMKLVQQNNDMVNPTILAGKSSIPRRLRGLEPLSRIMKREAEEVFGGDEAETYNLTALVIDDHAAEILRRFNACDCELCVETLSRLTAEAVPARFAKLRKRDVEFEAPEVKQLKAPLQKTVTSRMVRLVMQNKKRSYHD